MLRCSKILRACAQRSTTVPYGFFLAVAALLSSAFLWPARGVCAEPELPAKALKYHEALAKRPTPGYLFDRFYNTWLDTATIDSLEKFLVERAKSGKSEDGLLLAFFWAKQGNDLKGIEQFRATLANDPGNAAAWFEKAVLEARMLDFETALVDLKKADEAKPDAKLALRIAKLQGQILVRARRRDEAIQSWTKLLAANPDDQDLSEDVIELQIGEGMFDEAAALEQQLIERTKDPHRQVLRKLRLGDIRARAGKRADAVATYRETLQQVGSDSWLEKEILSQIERIYRKEDNVSTLKEEYEKLIAAFPQRVSIHRGYARILAELGDTDGAIKRFQEVLKLTPGDRANQEAFIQLYIKAQKLPEAIKQLESLIQQHPDDPELQVQLAGLYAKSEDKRGAAAAVERFLAASDKSEYAHLRAARLLEQLQLNDDAQRAYVATVAAFPDSSSAREAQAAFLYKIGQKDPALAIWKELAAKADVQQLVQLAKAITARQEHQTAFDLLNARHKDFANQGLYLAQLVSEAAALKKYSEAIPWATRRVELADSPKELEDAIAQAAQVIERGEQTRETIEQLEKSQPGTVQKACLLAELLSAAGATDQADAVLAPLAAKGELFAITEQIRLATQRREWSGAIAGVRRLMELPNGRTSANVRRLVEFYERDFQIAEALKSIAEWKKLSPGSTSPWLTESRLQRLDGKVNEAIETLRQATIEFENNTEVRAQLAQLYAESGKLGDAERIYWQQYEESDELDAKLRAVERLAQLAEQQGKTTALVENFEQRRSSNRQSIEPLMALAQIHRVTNNYEGRRQALLEAAKMKPNDLPLLQEIARIEEQEGDWERARATLERATVLDKTNRTKQRLARLLLQYGNAEEGYAILYGLAGGEQTDPREVETVADAMVGIGDYARTADFLAPQIDKHPDDYRLRYMHAVMLEEDAKLPAALDEFVSLLTADQEIPGVSQNPALGNNNSYQQMLGSLLPQETLDIIQLSQNRYMAYQWRQRTVSMFMSVSGPSTGTRMPLPSSLAQLHQLALLHVVTIAQQLDEGAIERLKARLVAAGVANADLMIAAAGATPDRPTTAEELLEKFPDRDAVLAYALINLNGQAPRDPTVVKRAFERFVDSRPQLALMAALTAARAEEGSNDLLPAAEKLLDQINDPNPLAVIYLCNSFAPPRGQGETAKLPDAFREKLKAKLIAWYPKVRNSQMYGAYSFVVVAGAVRQSGDPSTFLRLLDDEVANYRSDGTSKLNRQQAAMYGRNNQNFLVAPSFPPPVLGDFPPSVMQVLQVENSPYANVIQQEDSWEPEKLIELLPTVKDPTLRVLLAARAKADDVIDKTLGEMLASATPTLDTYLLAAGRAAEKEKPAEAVQLLDKARYLPMDRATRRRVDAGIVALVQQQATSLKSDDELMKSGRDAALRLRHGTTDANERSQLIAALGELGLEKEADRLAQQAPVTSTARTAGGMVYTGTVQTAAGQDQIRKLIEQGKRDAAAKLLAQELTSHIDQYIANPANARYMHYQWRQLRQKIEGYGLIAEVLATCDPKESQNPRKCGVYAMACELLGNKDEARKQYGKVLALKPKEDVFRVRLIFLSLDEDPAALAQQFAALGKDGSIYIGLEAASHIDDHSDRIENKLQAAELVLAYLRVQDPQGPAQVEWAARLPAAIAGQMYSSGITLSSLLEPGDDKSRIERASGELQKRRADDLENLCREMLRWPSLATAGFSYLAAAHQARNELTDDFFDLARDALLTAARQRANQAGNANQIYFNHSPGQKDVALQTPAEFLVRQSWQKKDWHVIDDTIVPALETAKQRELIDQLKQCRELYECPDDKFSEVATRVGRRNRNKSGQPQLDAPEVEWMAVQAWQDRKLDVDIRAIVLGFLKNKKTGGNNLAAPQFLIRYMFSLAESADAATMADFYEQVAQIYLGPKGRRADYITKNYNRRSISSNSPNADIWCFSNLLSNNLQRQELLIPTLIFIDENQVSAIIQNLDSTVMQGIQKLVGNDIPKTIKLVEKTGMLSDPPEFRVFQFEKSKTMFGELTSKVKTQKGVAKFLVLRALETREQQLGTRLLLMELKPKPDLPGLMAHVGSLLPVIDSLSDVRKAELVKLLRPYAEKVTPEMQLADAGRQAVDWIRQGAAVKEDSPLKKILAARQIENLNLQNDGYRMDEWLAGVLSDSLATNPKVAVDAYFHLAKLYDDGMQRNVVSYYHNEATATEFLPRLANRLGRNKPETLRFVLDILTSSHGNEVALHTGRMRELSQWLGEEFNRLGKPEGKPKLKFGELIPVYHERIRAALGERSLAVLSWRWCEVFNDRESAEFGDALAWLDKRAAAQDDNGLAEQMRAAAQYVLGEKQRHHERKENDTAMVPRVGFEPYHQFFMGLLRDDTLPIATRMTLAEFLWERTGKRGPLEICKAIVDMGIKALESRTVLEGLQERALCHDLLALENESLWDELAPAYGAAWKKRFVTLAGRAGRNNYPRSPHEPRDADSIVEMLTVYLKLDDTATVNQLLVAQGDRIGDRPEVLALLTRAGQQERAVTLARGRWAKLGRANLKSSLVQYDEQLLAALPKLEELASEPDLCYLLQVSLARLPDPSTPPAGFVARPARMLALAERFSAISFHSDAMKAKALLAFYDFDEACDKLGEPLAALADKINFSQIAQATDGRVDDSADLFLERIGQALRAGDTVPLQRLVEQTCGSDADDWRVNNALRRISEPLGNALGQCGKLPPEKLAALMPSSRKLTEQASQQRLNNQTKFPSFAILAHVRSGKVEEYNSWIAALPQNQRNHLRSAGIDPAVWNWCGQSFGELTEANRQARFDAAVALLQIATGSDWISLDDQLALHVRGNKDNAPIQFDFSPLLSDSEAVELGPKLAEQVPAKGATAVAVARAMQRAGRYAEAAEWWHLAARAMDPGSRIARCRAVLHRATALHQAGQDDAARGALAPLLIGNVPKEVKEEFEKVRAELQPPPAAETAAPQASSWRTNVRRVLHAEIADDRSTANVLVGAIV